MGPGPGAFPFGTRKPQSHTRPTLEANRDREDKAIRQVLYHQRARLRGHGLHPIPTGIQQDHR